jgi:hypothetical protein
LTRKETSYSNRRFWCSYILFIIIIGGILILFMHITRLASNVIFSPSSKIHREVGQAKDLAGSSYIISPFCLCQDLNVMWHFLQTLQMSWYVFPYWLRIHTYFIEFSMQNEALHSKQYDAFLCIKSRCIFSVLYIYTWVKQNFMFRT